jgi:hypothetical protein
MAVNDYTKGVEENYLGAFADLKGGINQAQDRVRHVISTIKKFRKGTWKICRNIRRSDGDPNTTKLSRR